MFDAATVNANFADIIEDKALALIQESKVGHNPTLLIFMLKALRPLKYRELTQIPDEHARDLLRKLEEWKAARPDMPADDKSEGELTAMQQVERLLKENKDAG
mgnify:FL=1